MRDQRCAPCNKYSQDGGVQDGARVQFVWRPRPSAWLYVVEVLDVAVDISA